jgi:hypothetical protein
MVTLPVHRTRGQNLADVCIGILLPTVLLVSPMSPFRDSSWGPARLLYVGYLAYCGTAIAWVSFVLGLTTLAKKYGDALAGCLAMSAAVALVAGLVLLPTEITNILIVVAFGGFLPFLVAVSLSRLAYRAWITAGTRRQWLFAATVLVSAFVSALPVYAIWSADTERIVRQKIERLHIGQSLSLRDIVPGPWTTVRAFGPYSRGDEIERILGFNWPSARKRVLESSEGHLLLVFASGTAVIDSVVVRENIELGFCVDGQAIRRRGREACSHK